MSKEELQFKELYKKALRFLGIRLRSEKEIRDKLKEWMKKDSWAYPQQEGESEVGNRVVEQLKKDRFLDDKRFAEEWIASRMRSKPRGEVILRMELAQKGIDRFLIEDVLDEALRKNNPENSEEGSVRAMALKIGLKNVRKLQGEDDRAFKFKMSQILARKGFEGGTIKSVVDEILATRYNTED